MITDKHLSALQSSLEGDLFFDKTLRTLYATDASAYREMPLAVTFPKNNNDLKILIEFAQKHDTSLIPRTAGTSLAGQVVGDGIVVDISKYFTSILDIDTEKKQVTVQPGVVRDELNRFLKKYNLYFGPETSTANRAMIGGMVGNNSCGSNSVKYGSTRDHLIKVKGFLSDGSEIEFEALTDDEFQEKCDGKNTISPLETNIYKTAQKILSNPENQTEIREKFPKISIPRRNTGYALDLLLETQPFNPKNGVQREEFNFCKLIAGSEGTLAILTEIVLNVNDLPPKEIGLSCVHFNTVDEALRANLIALQYEPYACELMDHYVLECTKANLEQQKNRFFVEGDPAAILVVAFARETRAELEEVSAKMEAEMRAKNLGYHFPLVTGSDSKKVWNLRKAGLGLLSNIKGDATTPPVIEDTAVDVQDLPDYIRDFNIILKKYNLYCVHYAHAGSGELHLRPIINLKSKEGLKLFRTIAEEIATLVKKYKGSLSGEHGDGRLRGEFIPYMVGEKNYALFKEIKQTFDPQNIFNPGKITDTPPMDTSLRNDPEDITPEIKTIFNFNEDKGIVRAVEKCNGSADCRKTHLAGGTMCPSYMATKNEKDTTRARANVLREFLTHSNKRNRFAHDEIYKVMKLCLSCKGCKSECPSNIDMAKFKAEFLQHYYDENGVPFRTKMISEFAQNSRLGAIVPSLYNAVFSNSLTSSFAKEVMGIASERSFPLLHKTTLRKWYKKEFMLKHSPNKEARKVYLFADEFTDYNDTPIGMKAFQLLEKLDYKVLLPLTVESGRTYLSKGLVRKAQQIAIRNVELLRGKITPESPLVGIEPSAILTFRDEYLNLVPDYLRKDAETIAENTFLMDEFIANERMAGHITSAQFTDEKKLLKVHGHCHQKSLSSLVFTKKMLTLPKNYEVQLIPSGCCGMAGSFGYEAENYDVSMQIGELVLFPTVRQQSEEVIIVASGTSCRHQIKDGTSRTALHALEVLWNALKK